MNRHGARAIALMIVGFSVFALVGIKAPSLLGLDSSQAKPRGTPGLIFGIYPGGKLGSVNGILESRPEQAAKRLKRVKDLASGSPFSVHLYRSYYGGSVAAALNTGLDEEIRQYTRAGIRVELVARFQPETGEPDDAVRGFTEFVRSLIGRYGSNRRFTDIQITNEANVAGAPDAADGHYGKVIPALIRGVLAARNEIDRRGFSQVKVGFNWAFEESPDRHRFWRQLKHRGGKRFSAAVDWVGLDSYPGTWSRMKARKRPRTQRAGATLLAHLRTLRHELMPIAGLGRTVPLHVSENGWPTGSGRSRVTQRDFLGSMVRAVSRERRRLVISDYRWFDLRDGNSSDPRFESQYGLTDDRYRPKPAYFRYKRLIARLGRR